MLESEYCLSELYVILRDRRYASNDMLLSTVRDMHRDHGDDTPPSQHHHALRN